MTTIDRTFIFTGKESSQAAEQIAKQFSGRGGIQFAYLDREQGRAVIVVVGTTPARLIKAAEDVRAALITAGVRFVVKRNWTQHQPANQEVFSNPTRRELWGGFDKRRGF